MNEKSSFKNRVKLARVELGLSQEQLANLASVSRQTIGSIESGQYCPTAMLALILTKCLHKTFEELFYLEDDKDDK
jgi:putative transcriptional regulator